MRRPGFALLRLAVFLGALLGPSGQIAHAGNDHGAVSDAAFERIAAETSALRDLPIRSEIGRAFMDRDELRQEIEEWLAEYSVEQAEADERVLLAFGFAWEEMDLRRVWADAYGDWMGGFYDDEIDQLHIIGDDRELNASEEAVFAHEITHALQDQAFDLADFSATFEVETNDDAALAARSLVEGDATATEAEYMRAHPELSGLIRDLQLESTDDALVAAPLPPIIAETMNFPYTAGHLFVRYLMQHGGWEAVNAAYADPPTSTEQVLHPDRYMVRDEPTTVSLPDLGTSLGEGWRRLDEDTLGEFQTAVLLSPQWEREQQVYGAAAGWDGDRYALWARGAEEVLVWRSVWDSETDADEFVRSLTAYDEDRFGGSHVGGRTGWATIMAEDARVAAFVERRGNQVQYVLAADHHLAATAMRALDQTSNAILEPALGATPAIQGGSPAFAPLAPEADECRAEPRTVESMRALIGTVPARAGEVGGSTGVAADAETVAGVTNTIRAQAACASVGDWLRYYALSTDDELRRYWAWYWPPTEDDFEVLSQPAEPWEGPAGGVVLDVRDVLLLPDGRVRALYTVYDRVWTLDAVPFTTTLGVFVREGDRWLLDESYSF